MLEPFLSLTCNIIRYYENSEMNVLYHSSTIQYIYHKTTCGHSKKKSVMSTDIVQKIYLIWRQFWHSRPIIFIGWTKESKKSCKGSIYISAAIFHKRFYVVLEQSPTDSSIYDLNIIPCEEGTKLKTLKLVKFTTKDWNPC